MRWALILLCATAVHAQEGKCTCKEGNASYLYLRSPKPAPADPDPCPAVRGRMHPRKSLPKAWNNLCWQIPRMACFLRRHAASWRITCTLCTARRCCPLPNWLNCPECHGRGAKPRNFDIDTLRFVLAEQRKIGGARIEIGMSPHFLVVTDIDGLKIATRRGGERLARKHELIHISLQRAEQARADFARVFGEPMNVRSAMFLVRSESTRQRFAQAAFGHGQQKLLYGGGGELVSGLCANGFALAGRDDDALHFNSRHMIGHLCISTYQSRGIHEKYLPQWMFRGAAHWLCKHHPRARDHVFFCTYEGVEVSGTGVAWDRKARGLAARGPKRDPVERMLQAATAAQMTYDMHVRAWSWFEVFTQEESEPFVKFVRQVRDATEARVAAKAAFGQAPEYVDDRWREYVLDKRRRLAASSTERREEVDTAAAGSRELKEIAGETDLGLLSGKVRGLEQCRTEKTARLLVSLLDSRDSDRLRAVIALVLGRTTDRRVLAYLRGAGYERAGRIGRATICRTFGAIRHQEALPRLRGALADGFWLVKANAARALAQLGDAGSIEALATMAGAAGSPKVRIAAMDALAFFGPAARLALPAFRASLAHKSWQVKVATCDAFKAIRDPSVVDLLITRLGREGGRVHEEILTTLQALTGVEKSWRARTWHAWWSKQKTLLGPVREPPPGPDDRYARPRKPPTYYGLQVFARSVCYVLDTSLSMGQGFEVSRQLQKSMGRVYTAKTRIGVCKQELEQSIRSLDPRTRLNIVFFDNRVRLWKDQAVAAGGMADNAIRAVRAVQPRGQTNYYDALRLTLGMDAGDGGGWSPGFGDTPDTLLFLTDGTPTDGEITKSDELLAWFTERNRFARLRVHVIALGTTDVDVEFLKKFAQGTGGEFVHLTGRY